MSQGPTFRTHEEILDGIRRQDPSAFESLFRQYADLVYGICLRLTGSVEKSAEILSVAFVDAVPELKEARTEQAIERDLLRAAMRRIFDARGMESDNPGFTEIPLKELFPDSAGGTGGPAHDWSLDPDEESRRAEEKRLVREILQQIPPQYGFVLVLFEMEEMSLQDIADIVNLSVPNVRARIHRARLLVCRELTRRLLEAKS